VSFRANIINPPFYAAVKVRNTKPLSYVNYEMSGNFDESAPILTRENWKPDYEKFICSPG